jgi:hypothetical protein
VGDAKRNFRAHTKLLRLALLAALLVTVAVVTSTGGASAAGNCTSGVSSVGPAVLVDGQLAADQSDLTPSTEACLPDG